MPKRSVLAAMAISVLSLVPSAYSQKNRITVLPLKDRTNSSLNLNISQKVADELMVKLTETGLFHVYDRENLAAIAAERGLKFDADFDPTNAPKSGLQKVCDYLVTGQIVEFSENQTATSKNGMFGKSTDTSGAVALKVTIRVTSTETGEIVTVAESRSEQSAALGKTTTSNASNINLSRFHLNTPATSNSAGTTDKGSALLKMVDSDIETVSEDLVKKIAEKTVRVAGATAAVPTLPKFVGMSDGLAMISRGSNAGIKVGQMYEIDHVVDSGLKNPETGKNIMKRSKLCVLTITSVDEDSAGGKCIGGTPQAGDELRAVTQ